MAGNNMKIEGPILGIAAIVIGILLIWGHISLNLLIGIFLIVFGIITLTKRR